MTSDGTVLRRLDRLDALDEAGAPADCLLAELRALAAEATAWVDGDGPAWAVAEVVAAGSAAGRQAAFREAPAGRQAAAQAVARLRATLEGAVSEM